MPMQLVLFKDSMELRRRNRAYLTTEFIQTIQSRAIDIIRYRELYASRKGILDYRTVTSLLIVTTKADCTDPRDLIFSVIGMAEDVPGSLKVDYSLQTREVFVRATKALITSC